MTNGEKITALTGREPFMDNFGNPYMIFSKEWWNAEYKEPKEDTTFTFGNKNKVALLINLDESIYKTINHGFLDTFEIRDVREAIINGKRSSVKPKTTMPSGKKLSKRLRQILKQRIHLSKILPIRMVGLTV